MIFTSDAERELAQAISRLVYTQPVPARADRGRAGGARARRSSRGTRCGTRWRDPGRETSNVAAHRRAGRRASSRDARERLGEGAKASARRAGAVRGAGLLRPVPPLARAAGRAGGRRRTRRGRGGERRGRRRRAAPSRKAAFYAEFARDAEHFLDIPGRQAAGAGGGAAPVRVLLPDPPGVPPHLRQHRRPLDGRGAAAGGGVAVDLHARRAPLLPRAVRPHGRLHHADHRPQRHRQGAGRPGDRHVAVHPVRPEDAGRSPRTSPARSTR